MRIGMFDSGVGGLTVLKEAMKLMPREAYEFYADTDHVPYGEKTVEQICGYADAAMAFLRDKGCDAVVIACNTATSAAARMLRQKYTIPVIGIEPAVKPAVAVHGEGRVLVIATPVTVRERKLHELLKRVDEEHLVDMLALPKLVGYAEQGLFEEEEVREYLAGELKGKDLSIYSVLVYGCTHFNHFEKLLREFLPKDIKMIDGSEGTVRNLKRIMEERGAVSEGRLSVNYYRSGRPVTDRETLDFYRRVLEHLK